MTFITKENLESLLREAISRINNGISKTLTARKADEMPPQDTRHLTDTRTRVSTLLEYSLSYELNSLLIERKSGYSISNILWNVFPDLIIRDIDFNNVFGLEVKALHTAAEEKSANLSTPLSLIRKDKDFIVILLWGWSNSKENNVAITYPHIHDVGVFDAWLIAKIRDSAWLINCHSKIKGIDISTPLISVDINLNNLELKAEEGNLGKLMRIGMSEKLFYPTKNTSDIQSSISYEINPSFPYYKEMLNEAKKYEQFKNNILKLGLIETVKVISEYNRGQLTISDSFQNSTNISESLEIGCLTVGSKKIFFITGAKKTDEMKSLLNEHDLIIQLSDKLGWKILRSNLTILAEGKKPDIELDRIKKSISDN
jgi:hypothetical protein